MIPNSDLTNFIWHFLCGNVPWNIVLLESIILFLLFYLIIPSFCKCTLIWCIFGISMIRRWVNLRSNSVCLLIQLKLPMDLQICLSVSTYLSKLFHHSIQYLSWIILIKRFVIAVYFYPAIYHLARFTNFIYYIIRVALPVKKISKIGCLQKCINWKKYLSKAG